jgi:2-polyprenyl-3-methyl-5-hydroxy-6-metoxy-1,4-benzoquinol methylase
MSLSTLRFRAARAIRRFLHIDRERRWNSEYAAGDWSRLGILDELAHHSILAGYLRKLKPGGSVLDVGCGEGLLRVQLGDACGLYLGIDFAEPVRLAATHASATTRFEVADMHEFTTSARFDAIIFDESLYYYQDQVAGLRRYTAMLAPNGVLLLSMHRTARTADVWARIAEEFESLDEVVVTNRTDVSWTVKALVPRPH